MKMLSETLREIENLTEKIQTHYPELYQELVKNPVPFPVAFFEKNDPDGLRNHLNNIKNHLIHQLANYKNLCLH